MYTDDYAALPVTHEYDGLDPGVPAATGQQYLRRVQREAGQCPDVVVVDIDRTEFKKKQTFKVTNNKGCLTAPTGYAPNLEWQTEQVSRFSGVRQNLSRQKARLKNGQYKDIETFAVIPADADNVEWWCMLCFGRFQINDTGVPNEVGSVPPSSPPGGKPPLMSIITALDQPTVDKLLEYHLNWFEAVGFSERQGQWLYALLAALEKPLTPETCALLRNMVRSCANLRASLESIDHPHLKPLNLIICLVTRYFDQTDLAD